MHPCELFTPQSVSSYFALCYYANFLLASLEMLGIGNVGNC